jgi:hypothetical protein
MQRAVISAVIAGLGLTSFASAAKMNAGPAQMELGEAGFWAQPFQTRSIPDTNLYDATVNGVGDTSRDYLNKFSWYYRNNINNEVFSAYDSPTRSGDGTQQLNLVYTNAGPGTTGFARFNATIKTTVINSATPGKVAFLSQLTFGAHALNSAPRDYKLFAFLDPNLVGANGDSCTTSRDTYNNIVGQFNAGGGAFGRFRATGNPAVVQVGAESVSVANSPLQTLVGGGSSTSVSIRDLQPIPNSAGAQYNAVALQWNINQLAPGATLAPITVGYATNGNLPSPGDANYDDTVNFADLLTLAQNYNAPGTWSKGDFNLDGTIDFSDLLSLASNYNTAPTSSFAADWSLAQSLVPEPTSMLMIACSALTLCRRRRA